MHVWLVTIGEPLPTDAGTQERLLRCGHLARHLARHGHQVLWWSSTFDHTHKRHRFEEETTLKVEDRLDVRLLKGCGYDRNVSLARIRDHRRLAARFAAEAPALPRPDIVMCSLPPVELCLAAARYGKATGVPVVLDMRDMWPDLFVHVAPGPLRPLARAILAPLFREAREACALATGITGITDEFVRWGVGRAGREVGPLDRGFPMGYPAPQVSAEDLARAEDFWGQQGIVRDDGLLTACFFGAMARQFDLATVIAATARLRERGVPVRVVLCGAGDLLEDYKRMAQGDPAIQFPGWVDSPKIQALMRLSDAGIDPLPDRVDFACTINNKAIEYLSAGLPVVASPDHGVLHDLLTEHRCGCSYPTGSPNALADALQRLWSNKAEAAEMRRNAAALFDSRFRAETVNAAIEAYLGDVIAAHSR